MRDSPCRSRQLESEPAAVEQPAAGEPQQEPADRSAARLVQLSDSKPAESAPEPEFAFAASGQRALD